MEGVYYKNYDGQGVVELIKKKKIKLEPKSTEKMAIQVTNML